MEKKLNMLQILELSKKIQFHTAYMQVNRFILCENGDDAYNKYNKMSWNDLSYSQFQKMYKFARFMHETYKYFDIDEDDPFELLIDALNIYKKGGE